jgi:hypothetical protein
MCCRCWSALLARMLFCGLAATIPAFQSVRAQEPIPRQIVVEVSGQLLAPLIERPIDEVQPVDEMILGARAIGEAHVIGQPKLVLADDPDSAAFVVALAGTIQSRTVGHKGPIDIYSYSETQFTATKRVVYVPERGFVAQAAQIDAETSTQTERIVPDRGGILGRLVERRGWNRVAQNRPQVNQIVQTLAKTKIGEAFDRLLDQRLAGVNRIADQRYLITAALRGQAAPKYECCTKHGSLIIAASSGEGHLRSKPREDLVARGLAGSPVQVWIHESVVGDRTAIVLRNVDLLRRLLDPAVFQRQPVAAASTAAPSRRFYDFAAIGDWIVVHSRSASATTVPVVAETGEHVGGGP